jgi:unsaturated pyranuronate lyase
MTDYFAEPQVEPSKPGAFVDVGNLPVIDIAAGLTLRPLLADGLMLSFARYEPGAQAPRHAHVEDQVLVMLEGKLEVQVGDEVRLLTVGQAALIPSWVPHRVSAVDGPAFQLDIFSPPRQGLLDRLGAEARVAPTSHG